MSARFLCAQCGHLLFEQSKEDLPFVAADHLPCPSCGGSSVRSEVTVEETVTLFDLMSMKAKDAQGLITTMKTGGSLSADGTVAHVEQIVDKRARTYKKKVTLAYGTVVKDVHGPLEDQSLHGRPKKKG